MAFSQKSIVRGLACDPPTVDEFSTPFDRDGQDIAWKLVPIVRRRVDAARSGQAEWSQEPQGGIDQRLAPFGSPFTAADRRPRGS